MLTFPQAAREAVRTAQCALLADNEYIVGSVGRFAGPVRDRALDGLNVFRGLLGCPPSADIEPSQPEFTGGQCPGESYRISGTLSWDILIGSTGGTSSPSESVSTELIFTGPVTSIVPNQIDSRTFNILVTHAGGTTGVFFRQNPISTNSVSNIRFSGGATNAAGGPGVCGSAPPIYPPPVSRTTNIDVTYNTDEGDEVTVTIPFIFAPITADITGNFRIPFSFDFGGNTFTGNFSLDPNIEVTINLPRLNPGDDQGLEDLEEGDPEDEVEPREPDQKIIGVVVTSSTSLFSPVTRIANQGMPPTIVPRAGSIKFAYSLGGATFWSNDIDIKGSRVFIPCPFALGADAAVASPAPGTTLQFVEITGFPLATTGDL